MYMQDVSLQAARAGLFLWGSPSFVGHLKVRCTVYDPLVESLLKKPRMKTKRGQPLKAHNPPRNDAAG